MSLPEWIRSMFQGAVGKAPPVVVRSVRATPRVKSPAPAVTKGGRAVQVARDQRSLCEVRGWRRQGNTLIGAYRTPLGSFAGEINLKNLQRPDFYIVGVPMSVLNGPHGSCFRERPGGKHFVHFGRVQPEVDAGIVAIERIIFTALKGERRSR